MKNLIVLSGCVILLSGCASSSINIPSEISGVAYGCKNEAKAKIQSVGAALSEKGSCTVKLVEGTQCFSGVWCWYNQILKMYVSGSCNSMTLQIAHAPGQPTAVHTQTFTHEWAHWYLINNYGDLTHNPKYDNLFYNWQAGRSTDSIKRTTSVVLYDNAELTHYDVVSE